LSAVEVHRMARGFESKSVADQQEAAQNRMPPPRETKDPAVEAKRRRLELSLVDVRAKMAAAPAPHLRDMWARAEVDLVKELAKL
jgi:hypothetical protein